MTTLRTALDLPLTGIRAVEASAGTGKTFTIGTLYLRLILERDLKVDEIVVATFTRAAAAELSERLRARLVIAETLLAQDDPATPHADEDGERVQARTVIAQALGAGTTLDDLRRRARDARLAIDTAFIGTLHGFCHRALAEFGFETGQALAQPELIDDVRELETEIVRDFWRRGSANASNAQLLAETWGAPESLAAQVRDPRWRGRALDPTAHAGNLDIESARRGLATARHVIATWDDAALARADSEVRRAIGNAAARTSRVRKLAAVHDAACAPNDDTAFAGSVRADIHHFSATVLAEKSWFNGPFEGAELAAVERLASAVAGVDAAVAAQRDHLLREARAYLESELPRRLTARNLMSHDTAVDRLADALGDGEPGKRAAQRIRARWQAALVDEFQDTDPRQWEVVRTLFGPTTLVLVGDPKQAIYGFRGGDVFAWLEARADAQGEPLRLAESWRAGAGLCRAINGLFGVSAGFIEAGITHPDITAADPVAPRALLLNDKPLPALELWWLDPEAVGHAAKSNTPSKAYAGRAIERACVAWIAHALDDDGLRLRGKRGRLDKLRPGHIAVLVNDNRQAYTLQAALGRAGVPASCNLRASVYASEEADDLALLLEAIAVPEDARRARAARASALVGDDATGIAQGIDDDTRQAALLEDVAVWAAAVHRHGPLAWLHRLTADAAPRLLATPGGQRRVANYLQLAELLQDLNATCFGADGLATRFARARVEATDAADAARLRLDTDADAVTIATVHAAKGLEYDVVLVPYAVLGHNPAGKQDKRPPLHWYHAANAARVAIGAGTDATVQQRAIDEIRAEDVRKLYVAVTRASALCILPYGPTTSTQYSALHYLLHVAGRDAPLPNDAAGCEAALRELCERAGGSARIVPELPVPANAQPAADARATPLYARDFNRTALERDWQTWSFSRLVRSSANAAGDPLPGSGDTDSVLVADRVRADGIGGPRFGTAVHAVFERTDFAAWRDATGTPERERDLIDGSLRAQGLADSDAALEHAAAAIGACVGAALNATLPCGARLCGIPADQRKAEIEFHLTLHQARSADLFDLLHGHGYQTQRTGVAPTALHGLLTGKIDLTFAHAGRFHIIDWKTNRCEPYDEDALRAEIALHDYDLQWLLYTLALHRFLRQRLPDYDYDRHVGDVYYLFVRGMQAGRGIHVNRPKRELIEAMDALFDPPSGARA